MGKNSSWIYIAILGLVIAAITVTALLNRSSSNPEDIRAKAGGTSAMPMTATVVAVDEANALVTVNNLQNSNREGVKTQSSVEWAITPPANYNFASIVPGTQVKLKVLPGTFLISKHTATATEITPAHN